MKVSPDHVKGFIGRGSVTIASDNASLTSSFGNYCFKAFAITLTAVSISMAASSHAKADSMSSNPMNQPTAQVNTETPQAFKDLGAAFGRGASAVSNKAGEAMDAVKSSNKGGYSPEASNNSIHASKSNKNDTVKSQSESNSLNSGASMMGQSAPKTGETPEFLKRLDLQSKVALMQSIIRLDLRWMLLRIQIKAVQSLIMKLKPITKQNTRLLV